MSIVVIYESPWRPSGVRLLEGVSSPSTEGDGGIDCYFLVWLGRRRHCAHPDRAGCRRPVLNGERRQPFAIAAVEKWHGLAV
jgi:hypothetical protein